MKVAQSCPTLCDLWNSLGQNTGVGGLSLLQGIFPTQVSNPGLLHCRRILYQLSHKGSPRILEWVACPFSSRSSRPRNWTRVSCIAGGFFTNGAIREALVYSLLPGKERINTFGKTLNYFKNNRKDLSILFLENGLLLRKAALICYWFLLIGLQGNSNYFSTFSIYFIDLIFSNFFSPL